MLDGVAVTLPALTRAAKIQKRMAQVGFDWKNANRTLQKKAQEELDEFESPNFARVMMSVRKRKLGRRTILL